VLKIDELPIQKIDIYLRKRESKNKNGQKKFCYTKKL